jgi:hypothetical protein
VRTWRTFNEGFNREFHCQHPPIVNNSAQVRTIAIWHQHPFLSQHLNDMDMQPEFVSKQLACSSMRGQSVVISTRGQKLDSTCQKPVNES